MDTNLISPANLALTQQMAKPSVPHATKNLDTVRDAAVDFEAQFLSQMLAPMFEGLGADEPFGGGVGEDMWRSLQVQEFGKGLAQSGGIGLADSIMDQLLTMQAKGMTQ
jgi:Rod binding domain-containing protein